MNAMAVILGGATLPLLIVLPILALVRPRKLVVAGCLIASLLLLIFALEVRGGVRFDGMLLAESVVAFTISLSVYWIVKRVVSAIVNNGGAASAVIEHEENLANDAKKRQRIVLLGSGVVAVLGGILSVSNMLGGSGKGSIFKFGNEEQKHQRSIVVEQPSGICYILIDNERAVRISGELDDYVTAQYDKDGFNAMVYFKKGTSDKAVRDYWWAHQTEIMKACGFVR